jgi:hypothetical protein
MKTSTAERRIDIHDWWSDFTRHVAEHRAAQLVEVLSDCSNEQYLNAVTAMHLRAFGRRAWGELFWARCEWAKTDISYGLAKGPFRDWDEAWRAGTTGDVGQIGVKLIYEHFTDAAKLGAVQELVRQLETRRRRDRWPGQQYLGIIWVMHHGSSPLGEAQEPSADTAAAVDAGRALDLVLVDGWQQVASAELPRVWPNVPDCAGTLWACLCQLRDERLE